MPFKVHVSAFKASVEDARIIIIVWTSTMYQMQAAAAVGGRGLNMPRGAAVKPVSRFQGPNKHIQAADTAVTSRLAPPVAPEGSGKGQPRHAQGEGGGRKRAVPVRGTTANNMSELRQPAPPLHDDNAAGICRCLAGETLLDAEEKRPASKLQSNSICCIWKWLSFHKSQRRRLRLARREFDLPGGIFSRLAVFNFAGLISAGWRRAAV